MSTLERADWPNELDYFGDKLLRNPHIVTMKVLDEPKLEAHKITLNNQF